MHLLIHHSGYSQNLPKILPIKSSHFGEVFASKLCAASYHPTFLNFTPLDKSGHGTSFKIPAVPVLGRVGESWESRFFLGIGVRVGVEKSCLPESRVGVEKICSTLAPNFSQK